MRGESCVVEYHGEPVAAIVPLRVYKGWKRKREDFFDTLEAMARRADLSPDKAEMLAAEAVQLARREAHEGR